MTWRIPMFLICFLTISGALAGYPECEDEDYDPICGSNFKTYDNHCELKFYNENHDGKNIRKLYDGECSEQPDSDDFDVNGSEQPVIFVIPGVAQPPYPAAVNQYASGLLPNVSAVNGSALQNVTSNVTSFDNTASPYLGPIYQINVPTEQANETNPAVPSLLPYPYAAAGSPSNLPIYPPGSFIILPPPSANAPAEKYSAGSSSKYEDEDGRDEGDDEDEDDEDDDDDDNYGKDRGVYRHRLLPHKFIGY